MYSQGNADMFEEDNLVPASEQQVQLYPGKPDFIKRKVGFTKVYITALILPQEI